LVGRVGGEMALAPSTSLKTPLLKQILGSFMTHANNSKKNTTLEDISMILGLNLVIIPT